MPLDAAPSRSDADLAAARSLISEAEKHDGASSVSDQALLAAATGQRSLVRFSEGGALVAVGVVGQGEVDLVVRPDSRGRGIGAEALDLLLASTDAHSSSDELLAWAHGANPAAEALLGRAGFTPVRSLYRMALDPSLLPGDGRDPLAIVPPAGLALRAFDPESPTDPGAWVRANAAAFATHPEQGRITEDDFALMRQEPWFDPDDLILLEELPAVPRASDASRASDELAGSTWIKTVRGTGGSASAPGTETETELYAVGVRPERAGQGLGRLLLDVTLARMAQHSPDRVTLYVDGENARAVHMYENAGFTIDSRSRQWSRGRASTVGARIEP